MRRVVRLPVLGACLEEVIRSMIDTAYRNSLYSASYQWSKSVALLQKMVLKKAFWRLMNLYDTDVEHRPPILGIYVACDSLMDMAKVLTSTIYTCAFSDPRVCRIRDNKPDIYRPDLLEKEILGIKEIVNNIFASRELKKQINDKAISLPAVKEKKESSPEPPRAQKKGDRLYKTPI
ncbi:MAG: hypothetical protein ACXVBR_10980 [Flavisolibacter sp.]